MKESQIRLAVIGCGRIARQGHLPYLADNPRATVVAAVDLDKKNCEGLCKKFNIPAAYENPEEMFDREKPDGVLLCTPNWVHKSLTLMAAERGVHVFCEKPMAVNAAECEAMVCACDAAGVRLQIGMAKRFDPGFVKACMMIRDGRLGRVSQIYASYVNPPTPRMDSALFETAKKWAAALGVDIVQQLGLWRMTDERTGGGQLLEMGTHLLDLILFFLGEAPVQWSGFINRNRDDMRWEDQGTLVVKMPSGAIGTAEMNMNTTADNLVGECGTIYGDKASLRFNHVNAMWYGLPFYHMVPTRLSVLRNVSTVTGLGLPAGPVPVGRKHYLYKRQMDYFVDSILGRNLDYFGLGPDFAADGRAGLAVMRVIDAAYATDRLSPCSTAAPKQKTGEEPRLL